MGKEFNPEAIKEKLAEIKEQEEVETFTGSGCLTDTAGLMFQDKLCKSCALELIAYSRKAQNHIDSIRPTKIYGEMQLKKELKDVTQDELIDFVCEFKLCLAPVAFSIPEIIGSEFHDDTIYFTYSQKSLKTNREVLTEGNINFGDEPCIYLEWESLVGQQRDITRMFELKHLGYWHNKGYSILDSILNPDYASFGGTTPVESVPIA